MPDREEPSPSRSYTGENWLLFVGPNGSAVLRRAPGETCPEGWREVEAVPVEALEEAERKYRILAEELEHHNREYVAVCEREERLEAHAEEAERSRDEWKQWDIEAVAALSEMEVDRDNWKTAAKERTAQISLLCEDLAAAQARAEEAEREKTRRGELSRTLFDKLKAALARAEGAERERTTLARRAEELERIVEGWMNRAENRERERDEYRHAAEAEAEAGDEARAALTAARGENRKLRDWILARRDISGKHVLKALLGE